MLYVRMFEYGKILNWLNANNKQTKVFYTLYNSITVSNK